MKFCPTALLHTVMFHRTMGAGDDPVVARDCSCDSVDVTYVAYDSPEIFAELDAATAKLYTSVSAPPTSPSPGAAVPTKSKGVVCVNFFLWEMGRSYMGGSTRKKKQWETWRFEFDLVPSSFGKEAVESKARVSESLRKRIMRISGDIVKKFNQVPKPKAHNFDLYFDMRCAAKPFLHEVTVDEAQGGTSKTAKFFKSVFAAATST